MWITLYHYLLAASTLFHYVFSTAASWLARYVLRLPFGTLRVLVATNGQNSAHGLHFLRHAVQLIASIFRVVQLKSIFFQPGDNVGVVEGCILGYLVRCLPS